ncbi:hypothetical protein DFH08DRAFT_811507 [Mycena albidolilacea]|uniref:DUF6818 domain-containing protein n=1 Tax=Mycena albidolilacea TaxID=1033008 RepID=A0AAD6ZVF9_9AGAR|nr:hypothetical protein DFH08DRAFT_811507 [Mycena albidolilacea]
MSGETPGRPPFTPLYSRTPELSRDSDHNIQDVDRRWGFSQTGPLPSIGQMLPEALPRPPPHGTPRPPRLHSTLQHDMSHGGPDSPSEHAFQNQFQFAMRPIPQPGPPQYTYPPPEATHRSIPVDPMPISGAELGSRDAAAIAKARGLKPADKVAGSRRNGKERSDSKGKGRADVKKGNKRAHELSDSEDDNEPLAKRGRPAGSGNYGREATDQLLTVVAEVLPIGQKGWKVVERKFNAWAALKGRTQRSVKSLEAKYKGFLKLKKPTGDAECPPEVERAHQIEDLINQHVHSRELSDDDDDDDNASDGGSSGVEVVEHPSERVRTAVARRAASPPLQRRKPRASGTDLANKLSDLFDPAAQKARDEARSQRTFDNTQIVTLSQQLRDERALSENLRAQVSTLRNNFHNAERARERAEMRLEMQDFAADRVDGKIRVEQRFPEGGGMTTWYSDYSTDDFDEFEDGEGDENKHPWDAEYHHMHHSRSHNATSRATGRRTPTPGPSHIPSYRSVSRRRTPTPGPSRLTETATSTVTGNAVEVVVTPRHGPPVALVISPGVPKLGD